MFEEFHGAPFHGDPEYINQMAYPPEVQQKFTITREEWEAWKVRHPDTNPPPQYGISFGESFQLPGCFKRDESGEV